MVGTLVESEAMTDLAGDLDVTIDDMPYVLDASDVLARCPTKYDGNPPVKTLQFE